jgi:hypothetical protein
MELICLLFTFLHQEVTVTYTILVGKPQGKRPLGRLRMIGGRIILKRILKA